MHCNRPRSFLLAALLSCCATVYAHPATERYIPIGQSPGISHKYTVLGNVDAFDGKKNTVTMTSQTERYAISIDKQTKIWLDRNKLKMTNLKGNLSDLKPGSHIEVKFKNPKQRDAAEWIKIEVKQ